jgi:hypothetical protein
VWRPLIPLSWFRSTRLGRRPSKKSGLSSRVPSALGWRRSSTWAASRCPASRPSGPRHHGGRKEPRRVAHRRRTPRRHRLRIRAGVRAGLALQALLLQDAGGVVHHQIHLVERSNAVWWDRRLLFRDYLRAPRSSGRIRSSQVRSLTPLWRRSGAYTDAKPDFISEVVRRATVDDRG